MTDFGYTMMTEQSPPDQLVRDLQKAEAAGFDFSVISDHYQPWLEEQGHSGYAWAILGAAAQATERIPLMTYVTCPTIRYHPAVVAQKAATIQIRSGGRFRLGLGAGENLNEHVVGERWAAVGERWPAVGERHEMLSEAVVIIDALLDGGDVNYPGGHRLHRGRADPDRRRASARVHRLGRAAAAPGAALAVTTTRLRRAASRVDREHGRRS